MGTGPLFENILWKKEPVVPWPECLVMLVGACL